MNLASLRPLVERPHAAWASVYTEGGHIDESGAKERELAAREASSGLERQGADTATVTAVRDALTAVNPADNPYGTAVFATAGRVVLQRPLALPPQRPEATWSPLPHLTPLLQADATDARCLLARIDRTGADFELRDSVARDDAGQVAGREWPVHRTGRNDWSERHFQLKVENTWEHNAGEIAAALTVAWHDSGADVAVLAGDPREREAVYARLPAELRAVTTSSDHGGRASGADSARLDEDVEHARHEHLRLRAADALDRFRAGLARSDGVADAVQGVAAVASAAREHRLDTLFLRPDGADTHQQVWTGPRPDEISVRRSDDQPAAARADDALVRAALATSAEVVILPAEEDAQDVPVGGVGALLRWAYEPEDG